MDRCRSPLAQLVSRKPASAARAQAPMAVVQKTVVWGGVVCDPIVWPYFFERSMTGKCATQIVF